MYSSFQLPGASAFSGQPATKLQPHRGYLHRNLAPILSSLKHTVEKPVQQSIMLLGLINAVFKPSNVPLWVIVQHYGMLSMLWKAEALF